MKKTLKRVAATLTAVTVFSTVVCAEETAVGEASAQTEIEEAVEEATEEAVEETTDETDEVSEAETTVLDEAATESVDEAATEATDEELEAVTSEAEIKESGEEEAGETVTTDDKTIDTKTDVANLSAFDTSGDWDYSVSNGTANITSYAGSSENVVIPSSIDGYTVTSIGNAAFSGNTDIMSVEIPATVTFIGADRDYRNGAFQNCTNLRTVTIKSGGQSDAEIGYNAFKGCSSLTSVSVPGNYLTIRSSAFASCQSLTSFTWAKSSSDTPNQNIGDSAFADCVSLSSVSLPTTLSTIAASAFTNTALVNLVVPEGVTSIGNASFSNISTLKTVEIPSTLTYMGADRDYRTGAFQNCTNLRTVNFKSGGQSSAEIGYNAFNGCKSLTAVSLPGNYLTIRSSAFASCQSLKSFVWENSGSDTANQELSSSVFDSCTTLNSVSLPTTLKTIGDSAFTNTALVSIEIPGSVTSIGASAFTNTSLVDVVIPEGVTSIGNGAFYGVSTLRSVEIPSTVTFIGADKDYRNGAFQNCTNLRTVNFKSGGKIDAEIGYNAFAGCTELTLVILPGNYSVIRTSAFASCESLTRFVWLKSSYGAPNQTISDSAFSNCTSLSSVSLPTTLSTIGASAFSGTALEDLIIPEGVTSIGNGAFAGISTLKSVEIPSTVTYISADRDYRTGAFQNDVSLQTITFNDGSKDAELGYNAFSGCTSLTSVNVPGNYSCIRGGAFANCTALEEFYWNNSDYGYANQTMDSGAFSGSNAITTIKLPSTLESVGSTMFKISTLKTVYCYMGSSADNTELYPETTKIVYLYGANGVCGDNATYSYADGVLTISGTGEMYDFDLVPWSDYVSSITKVKVDKGITKIGKNAFSGLSKAKEILFSVGVTEIGDNAFKGCTALDSISIPDTVTSISSTAFSGLASSTAIYNYSNVDAGTNGKGKSIDFKPGDVGCNNMLAADDAAMILQKVLNNTYEMPIERLTDSYFTYTDVTKDNIIAADDAAQVLQKVLDNNYKLGVEK